MRTCGYLNMASRKYLTSPVKQLIVNAATPGKTYSEIGKIFCLSEFVLPALLTEQRSLSEQK